MGRVAAVPGRVPHLAAEAFVGGGWGGGDVLAGRAAPPPGLWQRRRQPVKGSHGCSGWEEHLSLPFSFLLPVIPFAIYFRAYFGLDCTT